MFRISFKPADALHKAVQSGDYGKMLGLLEKGADPAQRDKQGATPLYHAVAGGFADCAQALAERGADVNAPAPGGGSLLHLALSKKDADMGDALIRLKADPNRPGPDGYSPLHIAVKNGMYMSVYSLLKAGADPNALTAKGEAALLFAIRRPDGYELDGTMAANLLDEGADPRLLGEVENELLESARGDSDKAFFLSLFYKKALNGAKNDDSRNHAQKIIALLNDDAFHKPRPSGLFVESSVFGRMPQNPEIPEIWEGPAIEVPYWDNASIKVFYQFDPAEDPDFVREADQAVTNLLRLTRDDRLASTGLIDGHFIESSEIMYDEVTRDMLTEWQLEVLDYEDRTLLWQHVVMPKEMYLKRRHWRDKDVYVSMQAACEWESHATTFVFRRGLMLTRFGIADGCLTHADCWGTEDGEDELLAAFNAKYES